MSWGVLLDGIQYLTRSNFKLYCAKCYVNPDNPNIESLNSDLLNASQVKRLISNYVDKGEIKDRLILNYIIILTNLFGVGPAVRILFYRIDKPYHSALKTYLRFLNFMPDVVTGLKEVVLDKDIPFDIPLYGRLSRYGKEAKGKSR